ncbi:hypothetical protein INT44_008514 [Umbelopsis vinacea]|uniref:t-SNARE coiled-coil homology domain-containing protein n=1 Tax=Umbelopsis vinacea TaxID=44442 RepID=A0A8H7PYB4_9FUNG|nr:hypothetical protein INT44_008514 [Umbelopsis vinacea]KAI9288527.1 hypothetical protein BC943DRAFT_316764 [Umbelopsis sp. AD052]
MSRQFGSNNVRQYQNQNLHNRAALLGDYRDDRPGSAGSGRFTPTRFGALSSDQNGQVEGSYSVKMDDGHLDYLESQNEEKIHGLSAKVAILKNITGKIGDEIRSGNSLLDTMNDQFSHTGSILGDTFSKFKVMAAKEGGMTMCYMVFFIVLVVALAYYLFFR